MCLIFVHQMLYGSPQDAPLQVIVPDHNFWRFSLVSLLV